jgi:hypothetical protein
MGLKWLDRRTWDKNNDVTEDISRFSYTPSGSYTYSLHVSTDKTKDESWDTAVVFRVRSLLLREQNFQLSILGSEESEAIPYEGRKNSRFADIVPLFRSATSNNTVDDYANTWVVFLTGFQDFFYQATDTNIQFIRLKPIICPRTAQPKIVVSDKRNGEYCPLSVTAINTPHCCRATFATNKQGVMETDEISDLIGHSGVAPTTYYQRHRAEDLSEKLERSDREIMNDAWMFENDRPEYIKADTPESSLIRNFSSNRENTIQDFGFIRTASIWSWSDSEKGGLDGLQLLRDSPMSRIIFRDTHVCPAGEECPNEVIEAIGEAKRCGVCPISMKCIDHLPAISAKKHRLYERVRYLTRHSKNLLDMGENGAADAAWQEAQLDTNEYLGWKCSEEELIRIYKTKLAEPTPTDADVVYLVDRPDIVRNHLNVVVRDANTSEFLLRRIAESNAYPAVQTSEIQALAKRVSARLLTGQGDVGLFSSPCADDVASAANLLRTVARVQGLTIAKISTLLTDGPLGLIRDCGAE